MNAEQKSDFLRCIENLSCSPLLFMNVQRFLNKERLFTDVKDAYKHICEKYFLHQDQEVRNRIQEVCGREVFKQKKNLFPTKAPYTAPNHSIFADLITGFPSTPVNYSTFKKVMKRKIFPFKFLNLGGATESELSIRTLFLSILANAFMQGVALKIKEPLWSITEPFKTFGLSNDQFDFPESTWFFSYGTEPQRPSLERECYLTYSLIKDCKNLNAEKNMRNFIMLYLWNRDTLVVDAFMSSFHRFKRKLLYPNFLWLILTKNNGMPRSHQNKIVEAIEDELLSSWSYSIYRDIFIYNNSNNNYIDSAISMISHYKDSAIIDILHNGIIKPFAKKWKKFYSRIINEGANIEIKLNTEERRAYTQSLSNICKHMRRKERFAHAYLSENFVLDDVLKLEDNPFLNFDGCKENEFNNVSCATIDQIMHGKYFLLSCPLQVLKLPDRTIQKLFDKADEIAKDFHCFLRDNVKSDNWQTYDAKGTEDGKTKIKTSFSKKKLDRKCKNFYDLIHSGSQYRIDSSEIPPLLRKDYYAWVYYAAHYVKDRILSHSYNLLYLIREGSTLKSSQNVIDSIYHAIDTCRKRNRLKKEDIIASINNAIKFRVAAIETEEKNALEAIRDAITEIDENDTFFDNIDTKKQMVNYCCENYMEKSINWCIFFWWICGYINYLRNAILLRKESKIKLNEDNKLNEGNKFHLKIKRIGLTRLYSFQKRTCCLAIWSNQLDDRDPTNINRNKYNGKDGVQSLYYGIGVEQNPFFHYDCNHSKSRKCRKVLRNIAIDILGKKTE